MSNWKHLSKEIRYRFSRSSGAGGQHVNKVSTRVELSFDLEGSELLTEEQKNVLRHAWTKRLTKEGVLNLSSQDSRSQRRNRQKVERKFYDLIEAAFTPTNKGKGHKTKINHRDRLQAKKRQGQTKAMRKKVVIHKENDLFV